VPTVDVVLEQSANALDRVVQTGSLVPTEAKELPTPITVVSDSEIAQATASQCAPDLPANRADRSGIRPVRRFRLEYVCQSVARPDFKPRQDS
jgi:hypothetical protein